MQIIKVINAKNTIMKLSQEKLPGRLTYKLMKFVSGVETEEEFYNKKMREIIETYCEKDAEGKLIQADGSLKIREEYSSECRAAISELEATEVDAPSIVFSVDELSDVKMSVQDMMNLSLFIKE